MDHRRAYAILSRLGARHQRKTHLFSSLAEKRQPVFRARDAGLKKSRDMQRRQPVLDLQRFGVVAGETGVLQIGAKPRRDVGDDRDAAMRRPAAIQASAVKIVAGKLDELLAPSPHAASEMRPILPVASFTPTIFLNSAQRSMVSTLMSMTERGGIL